MTYKEFAENVIHIIDDHTRSVKDGDEIDPASDFFVALDLLMDQTYSDWQNVDAIEDSLVEGECDHCHQPLPLDTVIEDD